LRLVAHRGRMICRRLAVGALHPKYRCAGNRGSGGGFSAIWAVKPGIARSGRRSRDDGFRSSVSVGDTYSSIRRLRLQLPRHRPTAPKSQQRPFRSAQLRTAIACPCYALLPANHAGPY
jgi:hypothetical protein